MSNSSIHFVLEARHYFPCYSSPHPRTGRRGAASSLHRETRCRLVALFPRGKMRHRLIPTRGDTDFDGTTR
ncbi:hypothetical protein BHE74_00029163 [Ensete ventricosum]|nr:hypothetical protein GW17_00008728 [Ensete ventricosum]RWW63646.1 hypothetical protein BHE74_00029163 [Ensete ventricosum]RZS04325.1 hypothetical protein BHM03_00034646 [Ensete ventricosum]